MTTPARLTDRWTSRGSACPGLHPGGAEFPLTTKSSQVRKRSFHTPAPYAPTTTTRTASPAAKRSRPSRTSSDVGEDTRRIRTAIAGMPRSAITVPTTRATSPSALSSPVRFTNARTSHAVGTSRAERRSRDTGSCVPATTSTMKAAVATAQSSMSCSKKTIPQAPRVNAGHQATALVPTASTPVARRRLEVETLGTRPRSSSMAGTVARRTAAVGHPAAYTASLTSRAAPITPASPPELAEHHRQVPGRQRERLAVDGAADLGQEGVPQTGHSAADDDQARVEERDQVRQHRPHPAAAVSGQLDRHRVAASRTPGRRAAPSARRPPPTSRPGSPSDRSARRSVRPAPGRHRRSTPPGTRGCRRRTPAPIGSQRMWPMSPAHPSAPRYRWRSTTMPQPMPVPILTNKNADADRATPVCCSPRAITLTSLSSRTGAPSSRENTSRTG